MSHRIFSMPFASVYPHYVNKAERKGRTKDDVDQIICWLTGYDQPGLQRQIDERVDIETFFNDAPALHPNRVLIKGVVCGIRVEEIEDPLMQNVRYLDKLIDELAKGKAMMKILRVMVMVVCTLLMTACSDDPVAPSTSDLIKVTNMPIDGRRSERLYVVLSRVPRSTETLYVVVGEGTEATVLSSDVAKIGDDIHLRFTTLPTSRSDTLRIYSNQDLLNTSYLRIWLDDVVEFSGGWSYDFMARIPHSRFVEARRDTDEIAVMRGSGPIEFLEYQPGNDPSYRLPFMVGDFRFVYYDRFERTFRRHRSLSSIRSPKVSSPTPTKDGYGCRIKVSSFQNSDPDKTKLVITSKTKTYESYSDTESFTFDQVDPGGYSAKLVHTEGTFELGDVVVEDVNPEIQINVGTMYYEMIRRAFDTYGGGVDTVFTERPFSFVTRNFTIVNDQIIEFGSNRTLGRFTLNGSTLDLDFEQTGPGWGGGGGDTVRVSLKGIPYEVDSLNRIIASIRGRDVVKTGEVMNVGSGMGVEYVPTYIQFTSAYKAIKCLKPEETVVTIEIRRPRK